MHTLHALSALWAQALPHVGIFCHIFAVLFQGTSRLVFELLFLCAHTPPLPAECKPSLLSGSGLSFFYFKVHKVELLD